MGKQGSVRLSFSTSQRVKELLEGYAEAQGVSLSWIVKFFVSQGLLVQAVLEQKGRIILKLANGEERVITEKIQFGKIFSAIEAGGAELVIVWPDGEQDKLPINPDP